MCGLWSGAWCPHGVPRPFTSHSVPLLPHLFRSSFDHPKCPHHPAESHPLSLRRECWRWSPEASFSPGGLLLTALPLPGGPRTRPHWLCSMSGCEQNFRAFRFCLFLKNNKKPKERQQLSVPRLRPSELGWAWPGGGAVKKPQINRAVSWPSQASSCGKPMVGALV